MATIPYESELREVFAAFASFGNSALTDQMDSSKFTKLCRVGEHVETGSRHAHGRTPRMGPSTSRLLIWTLPLVGGSQETKVHDRKLTSTDTDLIFTRVKTRGKSKITFEQFVVRRTRDEEKITYYLFQFFKARKRTRRLRLTWSL
jgi:hypothetical protein